MFSIRICRMSSDMGQTVRASKNEENTSHQSWDVWAMIGKGFMGYDG